MDTVLCIFIYPGSINHNKVFVSLDNYKTNSQCFQLHWSLDHYKTALDEFTNEVKNWKVKPDDELRSYDVSALFTSVSVDKALVKIRRQLDEDATVNEHHCHHMIL